MPNYFITLLLLTFLAVPAWSQEEVSPEDDALQETEADRDAAGGTADEDETDDSDLDVQTYEEDEDDFVPTEEIPADEPIPFPSNI